jgi:Ni/Fe-hydrogenase subunit HybB-like protein
MSTHAKPLGGPIFTRGFYVLLSVGALGILLILWRLISGLGATTAMSDGYPLGLWITFDVVVGTALGCGGYAVAFVVYIFNKGKYHPLVRPAILTSALGYSIAGASVFIDIGRWWNIWKVPVYFTHWNFNSALLEVALCIMTYVAVLWIEISPAFLEKFRDGKPGRLQAISSKLLPIVEKSLMWIIALGMLLPTMHQSSLGALMLLAGPRLHALWFTPFLPLFFLMTCIAMGYAVVVFESVFSSLTFGTISEAPMLRQIQKLAAWGGVIFVAVRLIDIAVRGNFAYAMRLDLYGIFFWIENILFILPALLGPRNLFRNAIVIVLAGALYRFDTFLLAFQPGPGWHYFPSVQEILISVGLVAIEIALYVVIVKIFPIMSGVTTKEAAA